MRLRREARVWEPIPVETRIAVRRWLVDAVVWTVVWLLLSLSALVLFAGCTVHVVVRHELKGLIRCSMDHRTKDLGFTCFQERVLGPQVAFKHPGAGVPPL